MEKEVAKKESTQVAKETDYSSFYEGDSAVTSDDVALSSLILLQGQSEFVTEHNLPAGAIVDREAKEVVAEVGKGVEVIPVGFNKTWMVVTQGDSSDYLAMLPFIKGESYPNAGKWEGIDVHFFACIHAYVLIPELSSIPYKVMFKSTSLKAGKQLLTEAIVKNQMANKPPFAYSMILGSERRKGKKGTYFAYTMKRGNKIPTAVYKDLITWFKTVKGLVSTENANLRANEEERKKVNVSDADI